MPRPASAREEDRQEEEPDVLRYHDVLIALSKARAAATLMDICAHGDDYLQMPKLKITGQAAKDIRGWIQSFADEALTAALDEAEAALRSSAAASTLKAEVVGGGA